MDWAELLPESIELQIVQMPGREERLREPLITDMKELVEQLTNELLSITDQPFAFFGHSMGAMVCFEVACRLRAVGAPLPDHLFLSARAAPHLQETSELRLLEDEEFIEQLHELYGAVPDAIRESAELREVFLPILKADVELLETHECVGVAPLDCPISVFGGEGDPAVSAEMLERWRALTTTNFDQSEYDGDHFYVHSQRKNIASNLADHLTRPKSV